MIRAGSMRHRVVIEQRTTRKDAAGQALDVWVAHASRRAALVRQPGREVLAAAALIAKVPTFFRLRYVEGVKAGMRLLFDDRVYDIKSAVDEDGLKADVLITADELEAQS